MLIVLAGLPGVGKSSVGRELARQTGAVYLRIDSVEQALPSRNLEDAGYRVCYAVAEDNLRLGRVVVADSVNPLKLTRDAWLDVARRAGVRAVEIEIRCSDPEEHRRRVETRASPTWSEVLSREYHAWDREPIVIDTAGRTVAECVKMILESLHPAKTVEELLDRAPGRGV